MADIFKIEKSRSP